MKSPALHFDVDRAVSLERAVLGSLLEAPELWRDAAGLNADDFLLEYDRKIYCAIADLHEHSSTADVVSVHAQLGESVPAGAIAVLLEGCVPENFRSYVRQFRESTRDKRFHEQYAQLGEAKTAEDRLVWLDLIRRGITVEGDAQNWRDIFHTAEEFENAPPHRFAINGFLQEAGITVIGGLSGHGKTLIMLAMTKALLEHLPLFGYEAFSIPGPAQRVLYLVPESSIGPFWARIKLFRLEEYIRNDRLLVRTLSSREQVSLKDPRLLKAAEGADVFLDTAVRFMDGSENDVENARPFADTLFRLLAAGARSITGAHHSPKGFESQDYMTLENILRGSGDIGAMLSTAWGVRQIDPARNQLYIQNIKPRDFEACQPFIVEGRPHLDTNGQFRMIAEPGEAGELSDRLPRRNKGGRPAVPDKNDKVSQAVELRSRGLSIRQIATKIEVPKSTVDDWLFHYDVSQKCPDVGQFVDKAEPDGETETM
jgi:hypothetical protein